MKKLFLILFSCFAILASVYSQNITVSGVVRSSRDSTNLDGVSVKIKGTDKGVVSSSTGLYSITCSPDATLIFTSVGYTSLEVQVNQQTVINVKLQPSDSGQLADVVVIGYGTRKKIDVTGAVDQIAGTKISERPAANVMQGLQGLSPGLNITYASGAPGSTPNINIRGLGSINGGGPLIIIDGIASQTDDLLRLNPSDVQSYSILKDGASAAIYGARSAFGVILITTKKGASAGNQSITYNNYFAFSKPTNLSTPITDPYIEKAVKYLASANAGYPGYQEENTFSGSGFPEWQQQWAKQRSDDPNSAPSVMVNPTDPTRWAYMGNYNPAKYFWSDFDFSHYHNLTISGSSASARPITYLLSADYTNENGLLKTTKDDWTRYGLRGNLSINPLSWLNVQNNLTVYQLVNDRPSYGIGSFYNIPATQVPVNPDGTWANNYGGYTAASLKEGGRNLDTRFGFTNNLKGTVTLLHGDLSITGTLSFKRELWKNNLSYLPFYLGVGPDNLQIQNAPGSVSVTNGEVRTDIYDLYVNYNKTLGDHNIKLTAGYNQEYYQWDPYTVSRSQPITTSLPYIGLTVGSSPAITQSGYGDDYFDYAVRSYFGRVEYGYKDRYIATFTLRDDGSSRFPPQNRWAFTPAVSGAWVVNKEEFWSNITPVISTFKLRASYAKQGNQGLQNNFAGVYGYIQALSTRPTDYLIDKAQPTIVTGAPLLSVNPDNYTWETVASTNFGTDIGFLKDRLNFTFDYYVRTTTGMLGPSAVLPGVLGTSAPQQNSADMKTNGWELSASYNTSFRVAGKPFFVNARASVWDNTSKITKYNNPQGFFSSTWIPGLRINEIWGLESDGYFSSNEDIAKLDESAISPYGDPIIVGWPKFRDLNSDGKIIAGSSASDAQDLKVIGNSSPRYSYSFNVNMSWNNFDFSLFLQGVAKADYYPLQYPFWGVMQDPYGPIYPWSLDYYRPTAATPDQIATYPKAYIDAGLANQNLNSRYPAMQMWEADIRTGVGLSIPTTQYLMSAAYLRMKNITLGYTLPTSTIKSVGISKLRIFFSGENIFEFSKLIKYGIDPEAALDNNVLAYPFQRKYSMGINLTF
jgi:TonB-linked SusC/RagA family outer membrane protein